jgi:hypothetical protein
MTFMGYNPDGSLITPPWAGYTDNSTLVYETVLANITDGVVFGNGVAFDLALMNSIPANVKVACSYQDQYCEYINSADSSGSPMTVEVGVGVNVDNYIAKDSEDRICFTSTDYATVFNTVGVSNPSRSILMTVYTSPGNYLVNSPLQLYNYTTYDFGEANLTRAASATFYAIATNPQTANVAITLQNLRLISGTGGTKDLINICSSTYSQADPYYPGILRGVSLNNIRIWGEIGMFSPLYSWCVNITSTRVSINGLYISGNQAYGGLRLYSVSDSLFNDITSGGMTHYPIYVAGAGNANQFSNIWTTGGLSGITLINDMRSQITNWWSWSQQQATLYEMNCSETQISNCHWADASQQTNNTYPYMQLINVYDSVFNNIVARYHGTTTKYPNYFVNETVADALRCGYNLYNNVVYETKTGDYQIFATSNATNFMAALV